MLLRSKEIKALFIRIIGANPDGTIAITYEIGKVTPKRVYNYQEWYINEFFEAM